MLANRVRGENNNATNRRSCGNKLNKKRVIKEQASNSKKTITSLKRVNYENNNEWQLANYYERAMPGQGLLPPAPQLELTVSPTASAVLAVAQLLTQDKACCAHRESLASNTQPALAQAWQYSFLAQAKSQLNNVDGVINQLIKKVMPWGDVEARPEVRMEVDNEIADSAAVTQREDRKAYLAIVNKIKNDYPFLNELAADFLKVEIWKKHGLDIDPKRTWFNRFQFSSGSSGTFTGWEHHAHPQESKTLVALLLENFGAKDRINVDALSGNSGIYTQNGHADSFGKHNEVRLLPKDFLKIVVDSNFSERYISALKNFWHTRGANYRAVTKGKFISYMGDKSGNLTDRGVKSVMMAALGDIEQLPAMTMDELNKKVSNRPGLGISTFSIYGYHASDIILIYGYDDKIILYKPSDVESFIEFSNKAELVNWVMEQAQDSTKLNNLLHHFSYYDRQDGSTYAGVETALNGLATGSWSKKYIDYQPLKIKGDLFKWLSAQAEKRTLADTETLTVTNSEVFKDQVLMNLEPVIAAAGLATIILPGVGSLVMLEAGIMEAEIGTYIAIYGDTEQKRLAGLSAIIDGGVNVLFGALGVAESLSRQVKVDENELLNARGDGARRQVVIHPRPGSFMDNLLSRTVVRGRGIGGISLDSPENGRALVSTLMKMDETLLKAKAKLATNEGKNIVGAYLGYEDMAKVSKKDIERVGVNVDALMQVLQRINSKEIPLKAVSIYDSKMELVMAYFNRDKKAISFADQFFNKNDATRLQILIHESIHATGIAEIKGVYLPDYFYISDAENVKDILMMRNEMLSFSAGAISIDLLKGYDADIVKQNFITKMDSQSEMESIIKFQENERLRKGVLLDNPDTQSLMIMELADEIPGTMEADGTLKMPSIIARRKIEKLRALKEAEEDEKYSQKVAAREQG